MDARTSRPFLGLAGLLVAVVLAACSAGPVATPAPVPATPVPSAVTITPEPTSAPTEAPTPAPLFPVALTDDEGATVTLPTEPTKLVSLTPAATETLFALGVGDRLVGKVEDFTPYPEAAAAVPDVARFGSVDVEKIVSMGTELVIAGGNNFNPPDSIKQLRDLGVPVLVVFAPDVDGALADIELIGRAVGRPDEAAAVNAAITAAFDEVKAATAGLAPVRVYYETGTDGSNIYGFAPDWVGTEMVRLAGGDPFTTGTPGVYGPIDPEKVFAFDPEAILLGDAAYGVTPEIVAARPGWSVLSAIKSGNVRPVDDIVVTRPGPRLGEGIRALALAIYPDLDLASPAP